MSSIRVDSDVLRNRAAQLYGEARNVGIVMEGLGNLSTALQAEWAGEETDAFAQWYQDDFKPNLIGGQVVIGRFAQAVCACAEEADCGYNNDE